MIEHDTTSIEDATTLRRKSNGNKVRNKNNKRIFIVISFVVFSNI